MNWPGLWKKSVGKCSRGGLTERLHPLIRLGVSPALAAMLLALGGCGSGSDEGTAEEAPTEAPAPTPKAASTPVEYVNEDGFRFSITVTDVTLGPEVAEPVAAAPPGQVHFEVVARVKNLQADRSALFGAGQPEVLVAVPKSAVKECSASTGRVLSLLPPNYCVVITESEVGESRKGLINIQPGGEVPLYTSSTATSPIAESVTTSQMKLFIVESGKIALGKNGKVTPVPVPS